MFLIWIEKNIKLVKRSKIITQQLKAVENPKIVDIKPDIIEHPKTWHKLSKTMTQTEKVSPVGFGKGSNSPLDIETKKVRTSWTKKM